MENCTKTIKDETGQDDLDDSCQCGIGKTDEMTTVTTSQNDKETQNVVDELTAAYPVKLHVTMNKQSTSQVEMTENVKTEETDVNNSKLDNKTDGQSNVLDRQLSKCNDGLAFTGAGNEDDESIYQSGKQMK